MKFFGRVWVMRHQLFPKGCVVDRRPHPPLRRLTPTQSFLWGMAFWGLCPPQHLLTRGGRFSGEKDPQIFFLAPREWSAYLQLNTGMKHKVSYFNAATTFETSNDCKSGKCADRSHKRSNWSCPMRLRKPKYVPPKTGFVRPPPVMCSKSSR